MTVAREISKRYEEYQRGSVAEALTYYTKNEPLGEIVVLVAPKIKEERVHQNKYKNNFKEN